MKWITGTAAAVALLAIAASSAAAAQPQREILEFTTDPYVIAECDGYDVVESVDVHAAIDSYVDRNGNWVRTVNHSSTTGVDWRSDTGEQIATYSDIGGTFTATADNTFTFTGIHAAYRTTSGATSRFVGRVVVAEIAPGDFELIFRAGHYDDIDPCSW